MSAAFEPAARAPRKQHGRRCIPAIIIAAVVVIEAVFAIPGAGSLVAYSAINKDFPVVQGVVLLFVIIVIIINLVVDILNALLDPRVAEA